MSRRYSIVLCWFFRRSAYQTFQISNKILD